MTIEPKNEEIQSQEVELASSQGPQKPALTIVIQSWTTPIVGIVMLVVGLLAGYFGRQLLSSEIIASTAGNTSAEPSNLPMTVPTPDSDRTAQRQELMRAVVEQTRHFRGDPDAPVTIIEFSDFQ
jgi:hypothetical protein